MSCDYADRKSWRLTLLVGLALFFVTRAVMLNAFPIFNDETIYLQYAQRIHDDWQKNKFISMNGEFSDWKPPLQYWVAAPFIDYGSDPLTVGRLVAAVASLAGFFGTYLFARELFGQPEGVIAAFLYVLCPPVLLHNVQFTAETFLFSTAPLFYWALLKAMAPKKRAWSWGIPATLFGIALLLFKQSGFSLVFVAALLPLARWPAKWTDLARNIFVVGAVIAVSLVAANAVLPREFDATRAEFNSHWVMSWRELLAMPLGIWRANLRLVADYIGSYYSWAVVPLFGVFAWRGLRRKNFPELTLAFLCLVGSSGLVLLLRGFNEYLFNTAVIAALLPLLARTAIFVVGFFRGDETLLLRSGVAICAGLVVAHWTYQDTLMAISPGKYIERSSSWAIANYLKSWSTGFGVREIIDMLAKEKRPGLVFADSQWGNPRTALEVYDRKRFPNLRVVPVTREFLDRNETRRLRAFVARLRPVHFAIYSADQFSDRRTPWETTISQEMCDTRMEIKAYPSQMPIIVCQF